MARRYDLTSLELFVAVCDAKSITRAAESESIAASAISKRISHLEEVAGTPLLARIRSGVVPTRAGVTLLEHARNVLHNVDLIDRDLVSDQNASRGFIRVFANASAIGEFLPEAAVSFLAQPKNADVDMQIEEMSTSDIVAGVRDGLAPIGICRSDAESTGLDWIPYKIDHLVVIAPKGHAIAKARSIAFTDTLQYQHVGLRASSSVTMLTRRESLRAGRMIRYRVLVSTFEAVIDVVATGLVIGIVPREIAHRRASGIGISVIPLTDEWSRRQFSICCRARRALPRVADQFIDHLLARK